MTHHRRTLEFGSFSSGTMIPSDIFESLAYELAQLRLSRDDRAKLRELVADFSAPENEELQSELLDELFNLAERYAPPYAYVGAHPGDGADFGVWLSESFEEDFDGLKVSDTSEVPAGFSGEVLHVNDHGNQTLYAAYRGRLRQVWALV